MTIKELYAKYKAVHVIYEFQRFDDGIHCRVVTPCDHILIEDCIVEVQNA